MYHIRPLRLPLYCSSIHSTPQLPLFQLGSLLSFPCGQVLVRARSTPRDRLASYGYGVMYCPPGVTYAEGAHGRFGYRVRVLSAGRGEEQQGAAAVQHQSPEEFCANVSGDAQGMYHWTQWMQVWAPDGASGREQVSRLAHGGGRRGRRAAGRQVSGVGGCAVWEVVAAASCAPAPWIWWVDEVEV